MDYEEAVARARVPALVTPQKCQGGARGREAAEEMEVEDGGAKVNETESKGWRIIQTTGRR